MAIAREVFRPGTGASQLARRATDGGGAVRGFGSTSVRRSPKKRVQKLQREVTLSVQQRVETVSTAVTSTIQGIPARAAGALANLSSYLLETLKLVVQDPTLIVTWTVATWNAIAAWGRHMWAGSRLLGKNISIASGLITKSAMGRRLIRREEKLLLRTVSDIGRLVPFSFFVIVPFMELLLPVALKIFPGLLPSTFEHSGDKDKRYQAKFATRLELAKEMQEGLLKRLDVLSETEKTDGEAAEAAHSAAEFKAFIGKIRDGKTINKEDITKNAKWFKDEFTMDALSRAQLEAMCTFMGVPTYGSDNMLRFQIRHKLRQIQADDRKIWWEGIGSLDMEDLIEVNHDRGMPHDGRTREKLEQQLARWIDLSMNSHVPASLLILSRTFVITTTDRDTAESGDALRAAIKSIEKEVVEEIAEELEEDVQEAIEKEKEKKKGASMEEKSLAEEAAEDLEELNREMALIKEERQAMDHIESQAVEREKELESMRLELAQIISTLDQYNDRVGHILQNSRAIEDAHRDATKAFLENLEQMEAHEAKAEEVMTEVREEATGHQEKVEHASGEVHELVQQVQQGLLKAEVSAGKAKTKVQKVQDLHATKGATDLEEESSEEKLKVKM